MPYTSRSSTTRPGPSWPETACSIPTSARCRPAWTARILTSGHRACQGCGEALGARYTLDAAMRATDNHLIAANATVPRGLLHAVPRVVLAASLDPLPVRQRLRCHRDRGGDEGQGPGTSVIGQGGDGGTVDIGFGCLSGLFERNDDVLFVCYDNQAYMNTGVQRSGPRRPPPAPPLPSRSGRNRATCSARGRTRRGSRWPTRSPTSPRRPWPSCATSSTRSSAPWSSAAPATSTSSSPARSAGARPRGTRSASRASSRRPASSRSSRPSTARSYPCRRSAGRCRSRSTSLQRRYAHLFGPNGHPDVIERLQAFADRNIRRYGLLADVEEGADLPGNATDAADLPGRAAHAIRDR